MRALWSEERASYDGTTVNFKDVYLRPQPRAGTIPIHIGGHTEIAARRAGRMGDGFFPFGVDRRELAFLVDTMRTAATEAGRDPSTIEVTVASYSTGADAVADVRAVAALGATRVIIPAALFGSDVSGSLQDYGEQVIARL